MATKKNEQTGAPTDSAPDSITEQAAARSGATPRQWSSERLFGDQQEIVITHGEDAYRLRITRNGKLILNK